MVDLLFYGLYGVWTAITVFIIIRLRFAITHFRFKQLMSATSMLHDLPSVTVCIPARNETHAMTQCLERVIASSYPKLEIIVLDDSSVDNTSVLIKAFAHEGVRFVEGSPLPTGWLGKNHALQELLQQASGTYVFFMDVDTRIQPDTIEQLIAYIKQENAAMISVMPRREDGWRFSVLFSPLRYFWELLFHHLQAPSTASNAWMIHRRTLLDEFGGFEPIRTAIQPESKLSAQLMEKNKYRFLIGTQLLGVSYEKKWRSQIDTSVRLTFPLLRGHTLRGMIAILGLVAAFSPVIIVATAPVTSWSLVHYVAFLYIIINMVLYGVYTSKVWRRGVWVGALLLPILLIQEVGIIITSLVQYGRKTVTWKGRPVTIRSAK